MQNIDRSKAPVIKDPIDFTYELPDIQHKKLANNIPLYYINMGAQEVIQIEWVFEAGIWYENKSGVAQCTAALLKNGTPNKTAAEINEAIEKYGATLKSSANNDYAVVTLTTLSKHLKHILPIVHEVITQPVFPQDELNIYKKNAQQRLLVNLKRSDFVANRNIDAFVFGRQHPYGSFVELNDVEALNIDDLKNFHHTYWNSNNCKIFVAGKYHEDALTLIDELFNNAWGASIKNITTPKLMESAKEHHHRIINDATSVQGAIRIARPFINRTHPDFAPCLVMNTIFGGYFGSRLMSNIREDKGYTYGIYSQFFAYKQASMYLIATEAGKEVCEATVAEVIKEAELLRTNMVQDEELLLVKNYILGNLLGDLDGAFSIMSRWKSLILNDLDKSHFDHNINIYKNVDAATIQQMAQKYLNTDDFYNLIVY